MDIVESTTFGHQKVGTVQTARGERMLTKDEAYAVAEFIDDNIFVVIRNDLE